MNENEKGSTGVLSKKHEQLIMFIAALIGIGLFIVSKKSTAIQTQTSNTTSSTVPVLTATDVNNAVKNGIASAGSAIQTAKDQTFHLVLGFNGNQQFTNAGTAESVGTTGKGNSATVVIPGISIGGGGGSSSTKGTKGSYNAGQNFNDQTTVDVTGNNLDQTSTQNLLTLIEQITGTYAQHVDASVTHQQNYDNHIQEVISPPVHSNGPVKV